MLTLLVQYVCPTLVIAVIVMVKAADFYHNAGNSDH